jgi:hypothetical protein
MREGFKKMRHVEDEIQHEKQDKTQTGQDTHDTLLHPPLPKQISHLTSNYLARP